eukprot:SAG31_NODE_283_length_18512_cov_19.352414_12_plen_59_part_00
MRQHAIRAPLDANFQSFWNLDRGELAQGQGALPSVILDIRILKFLLLAPANLVSFSFI